MSVADRLLLELCDESRLIELRVVSRAGRAPNVDDGAHPGLTECRDELVGGSRAVPIVQTVIDEDLRRIDADSM
jgi:hypothetical protein